MALIWPQRTEAASGISRGGGGGGGGGGEGRGGGGGGGEERGGGRHQAWRGQERARRGRGGGGGAGAEPGIKNGGPAHEQLHKSNNDSIGKEMYFYKKVVFKPNTL
jgi:hypothetical protein